MGSPRASSGDRNAPRSTRIRTGRRRTPSVSSTRCWTDPGAPPSPQRDAKLATERSWPPSGAVFFDLYGGPRGDHNRHHHRSRPNAEHRSRTPTPALRRRATRGRSRLPFIMAAEAIETHTAACCLVTNADFPIWRTAQVVHARIRPLARHNRTRQWLWVIPVRQLRYHVVHENACMRLWTWSCRSLHHMGCGHQPSTTYIQQRTAF